MEICWDLLRFTHGFRLCGVAIEKQQESVAMKAIARVEMELVMHTSVNSHAKVFGVSLGVVFTFCLVLSAASSSARVSPQSDRPFATAGAISVSASRRAVSALTNGSQMKLGEPERVNREQQ
jgi:hypothetical protein